MNHHKLSIIAGWLKYRSSHFTAFILGALSTFASIHYNNYFIVPITFLLLFAVYAGINFSEYVDALHSYLQKEKEKEDLKNILIEKLSSLGINNSNISISSLGENEGDINELLGKLSRKSEQQDKDGGFDISGLFGGEK